MDQTYPHLSPLCDLMPFASPREKSYQENKKMTDSSTKHWAVLGCAKSSTYPPDMPVVSHNPNQTKPLDASSTLNCRI